MFSVELDVFSGRPNPHWTLTAQEERELVNRLMVNASSLRPVDEVESRLGYRGMVVTADADSMNSVTALGLPQQFRLRESDDLDVTDITERWLLRTSGADATVAPEVLEEAAKTMGSPAAQSSAGGDNTIAACQIWWSTWPTLNSFWNGNTNTRQTNNCYNFASSLATNTFAQPGRGSGRIFTSLTVANIKAATYRDGYTSSCGDARFEDYLCIWPGQDYHFYHRIPDASGSRRWAHKPGSTRATNLDNSSRVISNPVTCNRGPYTTSGSPNIFARVNPRSNVR